MQTFLAVTLLAQDNSGLIERFTRPIALHKCSMLDSRIVSLGKHCAASMLIEGSWDRLSRLEISLRQMAEQSDMQLQMLRTEANTPREGSMSYAVDAVGLNTPEMAHQLAQFFTAQGAHIRELATLPYSSANNPTPMLTLRMQVDIPLSLRLGLLKEAFFELCDELNLDATLDPVR